MAESQQIVAARPLCRLQYPVAYLSRLQRILPAARWELYFRRPTRLVRRDGLANDTCPWGPEGPYCGSASGRRAFASSPDSDLEAFSHNPAHGRADIEGSKSNIAMNAWTPQCQVAFDNLKRAMVIDPVLALPDMSKLFTMETDALDFALGGILMQDGHPVAFESRKLKDVEWRYSVHEKELLELLSEFHSELEYRAGSSKHVADALSHRVDLATLGSVAALSSRAVATPVRDRARELLPGDPAAQGLVHLVEQGTAQQFWLEDELLMTKENCLYVPKGGDLRK
ncbi:UNVERIFIED_CONTAM: hypothetical protein Sangu_1249400 [Sesamum angustifolium]|uniref:Reverse transcriptase/retrotransposon-derived protein RNase H-like domain-containing protein n=1 Tax=Sesamum angustifolium TaxID=2727405 RepID=A0AAW2NIK9_9LAMI